MLCTFSSVVKWSSNIVWPCWRTNLASIPGCVWPGSKITVYYSFMCKNESVLHCPPRRQPGGGGQEVKGHGDREIESFGGYKPRAEDRLEVRKLSLSLSLSLSPSLLSQGLMMHRKYSQEHLVPQPTSFLSRQKQALYKKPVPINNSLSLSSLSTTRWGLTGWRILYI